MSSRRFGWFCHDLCSFLRQRFWTILCGLASAWAYFVRIASGFVLFCAVWQRLAVIFCGWRASACTNRFCFDIDVCSATSGQKHHKPCTSCCRKLFFPPIPKSPSQRKSSAQLRCFKQKTVTQNLLRVNPLVLWVWEAARLHRTEQVLLAWLSIV